MQNLFFSINKELSLPLVATAIHHGHSLRSGLEKYMNLSAQERMREEDPYTGSWTTIAPSQIIGFHSRFQVDLNRPRDKAIYENPEDAWGLKVWKSLPAGEKIHSLQEYDQFYDAVSNLLDEIIQRFGYCIIYDLHSYNNIRDGKAGNPAQNPDINIGTGNMNRKMWEPVVNQLINDLKNFDTGDKHLDVRENIKFKGGYFTKWIYDQYGDACCPIAIEFNKKIFMNEVSGLPDPDQLALIGQALQFSTANVYKQAEECVTAGTV